MRRIELNTIMIGDTEYPIYCDLYVLNRIQDVMSISQFERDILGAVIVRDEEGNIVRDENGNIRLVFDKYNIETVLLGTVLMINEGLEIRADQDGEECERVTEKEIARTCTLQIDRLAEILHEEFNRCIGVKKKQQSRTQGRKKNTSK